MKGNVAVKFLQILLRVGVLGGGVALYGAERPSDHEHQQHEGLAVDDESGQRGIVSFVTNAVFTGMEHLLVGDPVGKQEMQGGPVVLSHVFSQPACCADVDSLDDLVISPPTPSPLPGKKPEEGGGFFFGRTSKKLTSEQREEVQAMIDVEVGRALGLVNEHLKACNKELVTHLWKNSDFAVRMVGVAFQDAEWAPYFWQNVVLVMHSAEIQAQEKKRQEARWLCWRGKQNSESAQKEGHVLESPSLRSHLKQRPSRQQTTFLDHANVFAGEIELVAQQGDLSQDPTAALPSLVTRQKGAADCSSKKLKESLV